MKRVIFALVCVGGLIALGLCMNRPKPPPIPPAETVAESNPQEMIERKASPITDRSAKSEPDRPSGRVQSGRERDQPVKARQAGLAPSAATEAKLVLDEAVETLVSPQAGFEQKQAIWKQLKEIGKLDEAISALEQRMANDPRTAAYSAALGQAYLKKCALIGDVRDQAILAMKADQTLEA